MAKKKAAVADGGQDQGKQPKASATAVVTGTGNPGVIPDLDALGLADPFGAIAADDKKPAKSKVPEVSIPDVDAYLDAFIKAAKDEEDAQAAKEKAHLKIQMLAEPERVRLSKAAGELEPSIRINGKLTYTQPHGYKKISINPEKKEDMEKAANLKAVFGDKFPTSFVGKVELYVKDQTELAKIWADIQAICVTKGIDIKKVFGKEMSIIGTPTLTSARILDDVVAKRFEEAVEKGLLFPYASKLIVKG